MAQFGRPSTDTTNDGAWTDQGGGSSSIFATIDETSESDADYIRTAVAPTSDVYVTKLTNLEDPVSSSGHIIRWRRGKDASGGATVNETVQLRQGYTNEGSPGTLIATGASAAATPDSFTTTTYTLSGAEADAITDYTSLYLRFLANQV
jgi:hypothetical protein